MKVRIPVLATVAGGVILALSAEVRAQSPLDFILEQQRKNERRVIREEAAPVDPNAAFAFNPSERTYCVRTCDGYFFSIGFVRRTSDITAHGAMCAAACPGSETQLFTARPQAKTAREAAGAAGPMIEIAVGPEGLPYTALPTAYAFRNGAVDPACTCQGTPGGLPRIPLEADPTLRDGDIVVTSEGLKVFKGGPATPHEPADFLPVTDARNISGIVRDQILSLENRIAN